LISLCDFAKHLRSNGEVLLEPNLPEFSNVDEVETTAFLALEFDKEILNSPQKGFAFKSEKAIWATKLVMQASHYLLNRKDNFDEIKTSFSLQQSNLAVEEEFSADLMLRYLPFIINELRLIEQDDPLIPLLESQLSRSVYSSIIYFDECEHERIDELKLNENLKILAIERIVEHKKWKWLKGNHLGEYLKNHLGLYQKELSGIENLDEIVNGSD
jgi:hypothetical protein